MSTRHIAVAAGAIFFTVANLLILAANWSVTTRSLSYLQETKPRGSGASHYGKIIEQMFGQGSTPARTAAVTRSLAGKNWLEDQNFYLAVLSILENCSVDQNTNRLDCG
jgi:hypothetical protein